MPITPPALRLALLAGLLAPAASAAAQRTPEPPPAPAAPAAPRAPRAPAQSLFVTGFAANGLLGVTPRGSTGPADTLGILIDDVDDAMPAAAAGIRRGARLVSIDDIDLRLDPTDLGDPAAERVPESRLRRAISARRPGDAVTLVVLTDGRRETKRVTLAESPAARTFRTAMAPVAARRVLGVSFATRGSARDTAGLLITGITDGGAADKAGLNEGDRIVSIDGVSLRVPREDAGTSDGVEARVSRLRRTLDGLRDSTPVRLEVLSEGRLRTVMITPTREAGWSFNSSNLTGMARDLEASVRASVDRAAIAADVARARADGARVRIEMESRDLDRARAQAERAADRARTQRDRARSSADRADEESRRVQVWQFDSDDVDTRRDMQIRVVPRVRADVNGAPRAMDPMEGARVEARTDGPTMSLAGLTLAAVDRDFAQQFGRGAEDGALVVRARSDWAPVRAGDVILSINGKAVRRGDRIEVTIDRDTDMSIELLRNGRRETVTVPRQR